MKKFPLLVFLVVFPSSAFPSFITGNELLNNLESESHYNRGYASGFISGVFSATEGLSHCVKSDEITLSQVSRLAEKYLQDNPAELHRAASLLLLKAFQEAFPCD